MMNFDPDSSTSTQQPGYSPSTNHNNPYTSSSYSGGYPQQHHHLQPSYSTNDPYNGYPTEQQEQQQQQHNIHPDSGGYQQWSVMPEIQEQHYDDMQAIPKAGCYYPVSPVMPPWGTAPVTAIAFDNKYDAMYLASTTMSNGRPTAVRLKTDPHQPNYDRHAMLSVHNTHPTVNGMLYASVAGHPEASSNALMSIYSCLYGFSHNTTPATATTTNRNTIGTGGRTTTTTTTSSSSRSRTATQVPAHAYKPVYGRTNSSTPGMDLSKAIIGGTFVGGKNTFHMGVNTLLPLSGHVASVSPAAVRIHAKGGLQMADSPLEGMLCGTLHPDPSSHGCQEGDQVPPASHIVVGGIMHGENRRHQLHCMDVWQGLQIVNSRKFNDRDYEISSPGVPLGITALATSNSRGSIVAGCSDGKIRFLDGSLREVAKIRGHASSVNDVAVSDDGMLIATTGYGYRPKDSASLYACPDPNVLIFDIRYLGRGGIAHSFSGLNGGPRFLSFIPIVEPAVNRLLVASGQAGGGMQIIVPFDPSQNDNPDNFMVPLLDRGESICSMATSEDNLALGTSQCRVLQYKMSETHGGLTSSGRVNGVKEFVPTGRSPVLKSAPPMSSAVRKPKQQLEVLEYTPPMPPLSLDPTLLQSANPNVRNGMSDRMKSIFTEYILTREPKLTPINPSNINSFGPLSTDVLLLPSRRKISPLMSANAADASEGDYLKTVPTSSLDIDILQNHNSHKARLFRNPTTRHNGEQEPLPNPNKAIYSKRIASLCYEEGLNKTNPMSHDKSKNVAETLDGNQNIPSRYRLTVRPKFNTGSTFDQAALNRTGLFPGWDYPPTMPNAFASSVLFLLYFSPDLRSTIFSNQYNNRLIVSRSNRDRSMIPELGFLFHQMESLSRIAYSHPTHLAYTGPRVRAWVPSNFLSFLASVPEAVQLQILDGSPAAVDLPRRPEAFYLFLLYQIDKELSKISKPKLLDSTHGTDFLMVNDFVSGSGATSHSTARALTISLAYSGFQETNRYVRFSQILQKALCGKTNLRSYNKKSGSHETIVQRKVATSLPRTLSLSCACAGRKEEDGLTYWRSTVGTEDHWLPEMIEVELSEDGGVIVRECQRESQQEQPEKWISCSTSSPIPPSVSKLVQEKRCLQKNHKYRYQLDAVLSFIRDDSDMADSGHHVLHIRVSNAYTQFLLSEQLKELDRLAETDWVKSAMFAPEKTLNPDVYRKRAQRVKEALNNLQKSESSSAGSWILANGHSVQESAIEDARAFHVSFKEPCLVVYRAIQEHDHKPEQLPTVKAEMPPSVMVTRSITDGRPPKYAVDSDSLPGKGDIIAFDAEFVSVQEEDSSLTKAGSKVTNREVRHAVARISVIDCKSRKVIIDDHVLPQERVVDYLTRFSGIVAKDLDPVQSPHHLISTRSAYLKLRFLMERGCIFVGHGLSQDFLMVNLVVPYQQIIDTVEIFHQDRMRYISLRFLANYILGRDMQRDTHDSVEDALAAYEIYLKALELKKSGAFAKTLKDLYEYGRKTDWKLGVDVSGK